MTLKKPLVLDVDGTFLKTDMLFECFWAALGKHPLATLATSFKHITNPAVLKRELVDLADMRIDLLPVNAELLQYVETQKAVGRDIILASASDETLVKNLAETHGLSADILASDGKTNMKGAKKAAGLVARYGHQGFDYAGNETVDIPIWEVSEDVLIVGQHPAIRKDMAGQGKTVTEFGGDWAWRDLGRALRPHQYVKNVLLLLPMLAAHDFSLDTLLVVVLGMVAFSAAASSIYTVNDLLDLEADRLHATKHKRPYASGAVPIRVGMIAGGALGVIALAIGAYLGLWFFLVVALYMVLSLAYSLRLKRLRWIDIAMLATLYTLRVVAGAAAGSLDVSIFMLVFIFPVFITLGCVKRMTELTLATGNDKLPGRGYGRADRGDLLNVAWIGTVGALAIFFAYTMTEQAQLLYPTRWILWVAMIPIAMWLVRMLRLGYFGKQDYDPIVFALRDKRGIGLLLLTLSLMLFAAGQWTV
ncbi:MAG: UbiA family prenyltransferase [Paracoccaceae bacterium]